MAGYIGSKAVSVNTTSATISDDLAVGDDATIAGTALVTGVLTTTAATVFNGGFQANDASTITVDDNTVNLTLTCTDADATVGPMQFFYRQSSSAATNDQIGTIFFTGRNAANNADVTYASIVTNIADVDNGGKLTFNVATHDGESQAGLILSDGSAEDEIDVTIGSGTASNTVISGKVLTADGGAGLPSHSFSGDSNTGMFSNAADIIGFSTAGTERMRINSAGQITMGSASHSDDLLYLTRSGSGKIQRFYSGTNEVGSIGNNGTNLTINGVGALELQEGGTTRAYVESTGIHPWANNTYDLGTSGANWKDLHLSGGVVFGPASASTVSSQTLNDYEEGTWTPSISVGFNSPSYNNQYGRYIKVGKLVTAYWSIQLNGGTGNSSRVGISGLPYTSVDNANSYETATAYFAASDYGGEVFVIVQLPDSTIMEIYERNPTNLSSIIGSQVGNSFYMNGQMTYQST